MKYEIKDEEMGDSLRLDASGNSLAEMLASATVTTVLSDGTELRVQHFDDLDEDEALEASERIQNAIDRADIGQGSCGWLRAPKVHECGDDDVCEECCEHGDTDDHCCLDCGKDMTEDRMCAAYDRAKAARQDG